MGSSATRRGLLISWGSVSDTSSPSRYRSTPPVPHRKTAKVQIKKKIKRARKLRINKVIEVRSRKCPRCGGTSLVRHESNIHTKHSYDLRVTESGIRRQVIICKALLHYCKQCSRYFLPTRYKRAAKYFHSLMSWAMYEHVVHRISFENLTEMFKECFGLDISLEEMHMFKTILARYY